ncbi:MAG: hypothetical protein AB2598_10630 [Candidatus Thiodiazotropha sp.]
MRYSPLKVRNAFINFRLDKYSIAAIRHVLYLNWTDFYAWLKRPRSPRQIKDERLLFKVKQF